MSFDFFTQLILKLISTICRLLKLILFPSIFTFEIRSIALCIQIRQFLKPIFIILNLIIFDPADPLASQTGLRPDALLYLWFRTDIGNRNTDLWLHDWFVFLDPTNILLVVLGFVFGMRFGGLGLVELREELLRLE